MIFQRIKCIFGKHEIDVRLYRNPFKQHASGLIIYYGYYSKCKCCGKIIDADGMNEIPIIEPVFNSCGIHVK